MWASWPGGKDWAAFQPEESPAGIKKQAIDRRCQIQRMGASAGAIALHPTPMRISSLIARFTRFSSSPLDIHHHGGHENGVRSKILNSAKNHGPQRAFYWGKQRPAPSPTAAIHHGSRREDKAGRRSAPLGNARPKLQNGIAPDHHTGETQQKIYYIQGYAMLLSPLYPSRRRRQRR